MSNPETPVSASKPMAIAGRMVSERERLLGMTDAERAWRAQWLKDQVLAPDEPVVPKGYYEERYNVIRRFYRAPLNAFEKALTVPLGEMKASCIRHLIAKTSLGFLGVCVLWYHLKYNRSDWTKKSSWKIRRTRRTMLPGDPNFPNYEKRNADDYATFGFKNSPI